MFAQVSAPLRPVAGLTARQTLQRTTSQIVPALATALPTTSSVTTQTRGYHAHRFPNRSNWGVNFLPNGYEYPIERFGKYIGTRTPGLNFLIPFIDVIHQVDVRELCIRIEPERAYTKDNVEITLGGNLYLRFYDPERAVYGASRPIYAATQFAQSVMRTLVGQRELDEVFEVRTELNNSVVEEMMRVSEETDETGEAINRGAREWGCVINRFEITDLEPTDHTVVSAMHKQATALREKKETILNSEADRTRVENEAKAEFFRVQQEADAYRYQQEQKGKGEKALLEAQGEGEAIRIKKIAESLKDEGGDEVVKMVLAQQYMAEIGKGLSKSTNTFLPAGLTDVASMVAAGTKVFDKMSK